MSHDRCLCPSWLLPGSPPSWLFSLALHGLFLWSSQALHGSSLALLLSGAPPSPSWSLFGPPWSLPGLPPSWTSFLDLHGSSLALPGPPPPPWPLPSLSPPPWHSLALPGPPPPWPPFSPFLAFPCCSSLLP
ncbi:hypothetical protein BDR07DRAFT_1500750 [Suillus spraguei]|nr:hypothetical protein BDR07DRAFT_1500750 [Suillus spraguei]